MLRIGAFVLLAGQHEGDHPVKILLQEFPKVYFQERV